MDRVTKKLQQLLDRPEHENLEFKAARSKYEYDKLGRYCSSLANEGGGCIVLGVTDNRPPAVVGTQAFPKLARLKQDTRQRGLDRETKKELLITHLKRISPQGSPLRELHGVLPTLKRHQVQGLLQELKKQNRIHVQGAKRGARWHWGPGELPEQTVN